MRIFHFNYMYIYKHVYYKNYFRKVASSMIPYEFSDALSVILLPSSLLLYSPLFHLYPFPWSNSWYFIITLSIAPRNSYLSYCPFCFPNFYNDSRICTYTWRYGARASVREKHTLFVFLDTPLNVIASSSLIYWQSSRFHFFLYKLTSIP